MTRTLLTWAPFSKLPFCWGTMEDGWPTGGAPWPSAHAAGNYSALILRKPAWTTAPGSVSLLRVTNSPPECQRWGIRRRGQSASRISGENTNQEETLGLSGWFVLAVGSIFFRAPALITFWSKLLASEHLQKSSSEDGSHTSFMLDIPLQWPCDNRISLLCLPEASPTPTAFSDKAPSLFKPCKTCNELQHVIRVGSSDKALLCAVLGGTSTLVWHPAFTEYEPPMPPSAHCGYRVTWDHSLSPLLLSQGCLLLRVWRIKGKGFSSSHCVSTLLCLWVFDSFSFSDDSKWTCNPVSKLGVVWCFLYAWKVFLKQNTSSLGYFHAMSTALTVTVSKAMVQFYGRSGVFKIRFDSKTEIQKGPSGYFLIESVFVFSWPVAQWDWHVLMWVAAPLPCHSTLCRKGMWCLALLFLFVVHSEEPLLSFQVCLIWWVS